jgi:hypothetical protein
MLRPETQDTPTSHPPRPSQEGRGVIGRRRLGWVVLAFWIVYSGAVLGWHALTAPPADACIVR